ncbi:nuclear transport factor 2 family protein [Pontibacter qinzhouensis]|uniref:Nuclear transport factor 2 family protein n=1 Tax=Pontibacter qinzhouensis TaxID=2603253 RepID=A0A5C8JH53_9BACT|nr:nuclear transport factor 2 family protein [Pontibacter qinzhouensis]TXK36948.1 nuclear transport factor 2 family protein [Pontibacter qinzhouensis]
MKTQTEQAAVEKLLSQYAQALNTADAPSIPSFYTEDGQFMPHGFRVLSTGELVKRSNNYFKKVRFQIDYYVQNTIVDGGYAFVQATAKTITTDFATNREAQQTSRDFFVLRKEQEEWKIFRYTFNNLKSSNGNYKVFNHSI